MENSIGLKRVKQLLYSVFSDENGLLIKQRKKQNNLKKIIPNKQAIVNLSEFLPPPPEHPPPSECGDPPTYQDVRGDNHDSSRSPGTPLSPVSFSQVSACSCPNPHTQTPVSGWNMPVYSDNECPRCHSEKYFDPAIIPGTYSQNPYIQRTQSPRTVMLQNMNTRNAQNCSHTQPPIRVTPNITYQYSQPQRGTPIVNYSASQQGSSNPNRSSHSDNEGSMPCFQSYRITPQSDRDHVAESEKDYRLANNDKGFRMANSEIDYRLANTDKDYRMANSEIDYRLAHNENDYRLANSEMDYRMGREPHWVPNQDYRFMNESEWGPGPAPPCRHCEHDSGMGPEEEEGSCMDRACQSSLPSLANECINNSLYPAR